MVMAPIDRKFPPLRPIPVFTPDTAVDNATFDVLDGNGNDSLSQDEWKSAGWTADRFKAFDGNGDGQVSRKEFTDARRYEREFNSKDWNKDGELNRSELQGLIKFASAGISKMQDAVGGSAQAILKCMPSMIRDRFATMDTDKSGGVSKEEYMKGRRREESPIIWRDGIQPLNKRDMLLASVNDKK
jgi:Ca2+-binding EF-hand superfamily protein